MLPTHSQGRPARGQYREPRTGGNQRGDLRSRAEDLLAVVEQKQQVLRREESREGVQQRLPGPLAHAKGAGNGRKDELGVPQRRQIDEYGAIAECARQVVADLEGESGLARTPAPVRVTNRISLACNRETSVASSRSRPRSGVRGNWSGA